MTKKINSDKIIRLVYEACKRSLKEGQGDVEQGQPQNTQTQLRTRFPIDYHVSINDGKFYFNITFKDKNLFGTVSTLRTDLIKRLMFICDRPIIDALYEKYGTGLLNTKQYKALFERYKKYFNLHVYSDKENKSNSPDVLIFNTLLEHPEAIYDDNGNINMKCKDVVCVRELIKNFAKRIGYELSEGDVEAAIKSAFYGVKNMITRKMQDGFEDDAKQLFFDVCQTLGNEETQKLLRTVQLGSSGFLFDSQMSLLNRLRVISQATKYDQNGGNQVNTISYLQTERQWRKLGRVVVDYSHPYYIVVKHGGRMGDEYEDTMVAGMGYKYLEDNHGFLARKHRNKEGNPNYGREGFGYHAVYDVQATQVMQGYYDEWSNSAALKNNITGELNDIAQAKFNELNGGVNGNERTEKLNSLFNTTDYEGVNAIYKAVCMTANKKPNFADDTDVKTIIMETGRIIDDMIRKKLSSFDKGGGHIALAKNYQDLVPIGRIIIQSIIGLPMDSAPAIQWSEEHKEKAGTLSEIVNTISNSIINNRKELMKVQNTNISEMINLYSPMFVFEETFNNTLKLIEENVKYF